MTQALRTPARRFVNALFRAGLAAVQGQRCVAEYLSRNSVPQPVYLIAMGKAACAMTRGALEALHQQVVKGLIITKTAHGDRQLERDLRFHCIESAHPLPDHESLLAGEALCQFLDEAPGDASLLFLISGGASSLVEVLPQDIRLGDLRRANQWLLGSGLPIETINRVRQTLSRIKGGGLLDWVKDRPTTVLLISDVPGDDPHTIASGMLYPAEHTSLPTGLPDWLLRPERRTSSRRDLCAAVNHHIIASNAMALQAAADRGRALGCAVTVMEEPLAGDAQLVGEAIVSQLQALPEGCYLWGGETTVALPETTGTGGRNTHLALAAARRMTLRDSMVILAAGTDGTDGPTGYAGAIVDASTLRRGQRQGFDAQVCLQQADSARYLASSGDLLQTGPTGTNVMDMVVACKGDCTPVEHDTSEDSS
jgi:hydroxypyruvate reductase